MLNNTNSVKWLALVTLVVQNAAAAIVMRYSFLAQKDIEDKYIPSTAVVCAECMKLVISVVLIYVADSSSSLKKLQSTCHQDLVVNYNDW